MKKNKRKKRRLTAILAAVIMSVGMMAAPLVAHAYVVDVVAVYGFNLYLEHYTHGYNTPVQDKNPGYPLFWVYYQTCSAGPNYPVNFLVIDSDNEQITYNVIVSGSNHTGHEEYYNKYHEGDVQLRANTGSYQDGYTITGSWGPNAYYYVTP